MAGDAEKAITVEEFISLQSPDEITYYNFSFHTYLNGYDMFLTNILYDYNDEFEDLVVTVELNNLEYCKYKYKPHVLALDIYGSTELAFIVMMLNGIIDPKEFTFTKVKLIKTADLMTLLNRIYSLNVEQLSDNRSKVQSEFASNDGNSIWTE